MAFDFDDWTRGTGDNFAVRDVLVSGVTSRDAAAHVFSQATLLSQPIWTKGRGGRSVAGRGRLHLTPNTLAADISSTSTQSTPKLQATTGPIVSLPDAAAQALTLYVVFMPGAVPTGNREVLSWFAGSVPILSFQNVAATNRMRVLASLNGTGTGQNVAVESADLPAFQSVVYAISFGGSGTPYRLQRNLGAPIVGANSAKVAMTGSLFTIGMRSGGVETDVMAVHLRNTQHDQSTINANVAALMAKWGVA